MIFELFYVCINQGGQRANNNYDGRFRNVEPSIVQIYTYSRNDLKERLPASSWKHRKHIFLLDEVEQGFYPGQVSTQQCWKKNTIQRRLYCTTKGSLEFATIVRLCFFETKNRFLGLLGSIPEIRPIRVLVRSLSLGKVWD